MAHHNLLAKERKCKLFEMSIPFLGHVVSEERITTGPTKVEKICHLSAPKDKRAIRSILGFGNNYKWFIKSYCVITAEMPVPPPFVPLGAMVGVEATNKASSTVTVTTQQDTLMETDASTAPEVPARPPLPAPTAAKAKVINVPAMVEEAGLTIWLDMILKGHPCGRVTNWEQ